ncbi:hypothetical protein [Microvirga lotononidis]|uniref:hypothetical protein n=1 Tax=Microvirga lotononidis TaxID=864069 RepID=UPI0005906151|nr:hypothetical protein [Microvirga lotononidis]WQO28126.1 hypothetical protein U0023_03200 [Microvirga lotononidis]
MAAFAQSGRPWVDPPSETDGRVQAPVSAPASLPAKPPAQVAAPPAPAHSDAKASVETRPVEDTTPPKPIKTASDKPTKQKAVVERKTRAASQQASSAPRNQRQATQNVRRRASGTELSQAEPRNGIERRVRAARYGSVQEGLDAGLQVMRLRTIQLPDGRRIEVLTRPDQDIASGLPDGY